MRLEPPRSAAGGAFVTGRKSGLTATDGTVNIAHDLGANARVFLQPEQPVQLSLDGPITATNIKVRANWHDGNAVVSTWLDIHWLAVA
jgi:hypothetical protein